MTCASCGEPMVPSQEFCSSCGAAVVERWVRVVPKLEESAWRTWRVATIFRSLLTWYGSALLLGLFGYVLEASSGSRGIEAPLLGLVGMVVFLSTTSIQTYRMTSAMGSRAPVLWALAMGVPCCFPLFVLAILGWRARAWLQERGVQVGFLGPDPAVLEELRKAVGE